MDGPKALVVDDDADARRALSRELGGAGFECRSASDGFEALIRLRSEPMDLVVSDFQMPGMDGLALLKAVRETSDIPVIVISAVGTIPICEAVMRAGAARFLQLRHDIDELGRIARELLEQSPARDDERVRSPSEARSRADFDDRLVCVGADCDGNLSEMSRRTGRDRKTLRHHLRRFNLIDP